jgi:hypothetical protein
VKDDKTWSGWARAVNVNRLPHLDQFVAGVASRWWSVRRSRQLAENGHSARKDHAVIDLPELCGGRSAIIGPARIREET